MVMHSGNVRAGTSGLKKHSTLKVSETLWGYAVRKSGASDIWAAIGELVATSGCLFFAAASFGQWLLPGSMYNGAILPLKISGTVVFFAVSALLYRIARQGLSEVVQIDTQRQKVSILRRNRYGHTTVKSTIAFADIGSVFIKRSKSDFVASSMYIRPASGLASMLIASGSARELEPLLDRIQSDCRNRRVPVKKPVRLNVDRATPRQTRNAFASG